MRKRYLKYIFSFLLFISILISNIVRVEASPSEYIIQKYNIDMTVNENNTLDITERITANFYVEKHGIFRKIPLKNSITRTDGTKSSNRARITNISVNEEYTTYNENGYKVIKIGNANSTLRGKHTYTIRYTYNLGKDPLEDADELYFNLIGDEWDTNIEDASFKISMPKSFDESLLGFSSGYKGSTDSSNILYTVNNNVIIGSLQTTLFQGQSLTVRLTLPDGYFVGASSNINTYAILIIILSILFILIAARLWSKYGKDDTVIETVEFYPPEGYNSAEVGFLYKGLADTESAISLLIYLADKGYIKIVENDDRNAKLNDDKKEQIDLKIQELEREIEEEKLRDKNSPKVKILENSLETYKNIYKTNEYEEEDFSSKFTLNNSENKCTIIKIKEYDGDNACERIFMEGLFKHSRTSVRLSLLYNDFYKTLDKIKTKLNSRKKQIFEKVSTSKTKWLVFMIIAIYMLITVKPILDYEGAEILPVVLIFPTIALIVVSSFIREMNKINVAALFFMIIWGLGFGGLPLLSTVLPAIAQDTMYMIMYAIGLVSIAIILIFIKIMPKRTAYGNEMLGKLRGFKRFLETAEKQQLEDLVEQNPEYFYNILPYTYALGVSNVWMKQFETIAMREPNWYEGSEAFRINHFNHFMSDTMKAAKTTMSSSPSSSSGGGSSGGGSSGGGSSGGGSGGGGGGSW